MHLAISFCSTQLGTLVFVLSIFFSSPNILLSIFFIATFISSFSRECTTFSAEFFVLVARKKADKTLSCAHPNHSISLRLQLMCGFSSPRRSFFVFFSSTGLPIHGYSFWVAALAKRPDQYQWVS